MIVWLDSGRNPFCCRSENHFASCLLLFFLLSHSVHGQKSTQQFIYPPEHMKIVPIPKMFINIMPFAAIDPCWSCLCSADSIRFSIIPCYLFEWFGRRVLRLMTITNEYCKFFLCCRHNTNTCALTNTKIHTHTHTRSRTKPDIPSLQRNQWAQSARNRKKSE